MTLEEAAGLRFDTLVAGYFDPVVADHARRLEASGAGLTISLLEPPDPLLPARARAELLAAFACVERVILGDARALAGSVIDETAADLAARQALVERILSRQ